ncbi:hypothetical protein MESS4_p40061 [Mesorhizobium sp. STM 4661]|nr:hypothetical protein MESS4_p40061 [Mesorhizobium sp. STM 4661]
MYRLPMQATILSWRIWRELIEAAVRHWHPGPRQATMPSEFNAGSRAEPRPRRCFIARV